MGNRNGFHTFTGRWFDYESFTADDICLDDIAHHLSMDCRFGGAEREFFSVAEHCLHCRSLIDVMPEGPVQVGSGRPPTRFTDDFGSEERAALLILLHDAHEAYTKDFPHYLKEEIPAIVELQDRIDVAIWEHFGIDPPKFSRGESMQIYKIDKTAMLAEARVLVPSEVYTLLKSSYPKIDANAPAPSFGYAPVTVELLYKSEVLSLL